jgi:hypothetical protein
MNKRKPPVDPIPIHRKFGFEHMMDRERIRLELVGDNRDGYQFDSAIEFEITRRLEQEAFDNPKPSLSERQAVARAANRTFTGNMNLSVEQLEYVIEMFGQSNSPIALDIAAKAENALNKKADYDSESKVINDCAQKVRDKYPDFYK